MAESVTRRSLSSARMSRLPVVLLLACALLLAACGGSDKEKAASTSSASGDSASGGSTGCAKVPAAKPKDVKLPKPTEELKPGKTYVARVLTNCGEFEITLDPKHAPK